MSRPGARQHSHPVYHHLRLSATEEFHSVLFGDAGDALPILSGASVGDGLDQQSLLAIPAGGATMQFWNLRSGVLLSNQATFSKLSEFSSSRKVGLCENITSVSAPRPQAREFAGLTRTRNTEVGM